MTDRYADFDAAFAEASIEPLRFKMYGQDWELPPTLPAAAVLKIARVQAAGRGAEELSKSELFDIAADCIPPDTLNALMDKGLDVDRLGQLLVWAMRQYMGKADDLGEAEAPKGPSISSSHDGESSKPTSLVSTGSI